MITFKLYFRFYWPDCSHWVIVEYMKSEWHCYFCPSLRFYKKKKDTSSRTKAQKWGQKQSSYGCIISLWQKIRKIRDKIRTKKDFFQRIFSELENLQLFKGAGGSEVDFYFFVVSDRGNCQL